MSVYEHNLYPYNIHTPAPLRILALLKHAAYDDMIYPAHG